MCSSRRIGDVVSCMLGVGNRNRNIISGRGIEIVSNCHYAPAAGIGHEEYLRTCLFYVSDGENHWFSPFIVIGDSSLTH